MMKWISGAGIAALAFATTLAAAPTPPQQPSSERSQTYKGRVPDKPSAKNQAGKAREATIAGCLVRDAANGGDASISSNGISYRLIGKDEQQLEQFLGKRVEVTGLLESGSTARATSGKGTDPGASIPPKGQTATGGQSDVRTPRDNTVPADALPLATDKGTTADLIGRVQVKTIKIVSPNCL